MNDNYKQNRRHLRKKMIAEVCYKDEKNKSCGGCVAKNVSERGACIKIGRFFPVGTTLNLEFKLPLSPTSFYVKGKIMWISKLPHNEQWEAGLEIIMDTVYAALIKKYISLKDPTD